MRYGTPADLSRLREFGELGYVFPSPSKLKKKTPKLAPKTIRVMYVGFEEQLGSNLYRMGSPKTKTLYVSRDVLWTVRQYYHDSKPSRLSCRSHLGRHA